MSSLRQRFASFCHKIGCTGTLGIIAVSQDLKWVFGERKPDFLRVTAEFVSEAVEKSQGGFLRSGVIENLDEQDPKLLYVEVVR